MIVGWVDMTILPDPVCAVEVKGGPSLSAKLVPLASPIVGFFSVGEVESTRSPVPVCVDVCKAGPSLILMPF